MIPVFVLIALEKIINTTLKTDAITQAGLRPLAGKVMRLVIHEPAVEFDIIFNEDHLRFEPVAISVFEPKGSELSKLVQPDCIVTVNHARELFELLAQEQGNLPIAGDYKVLMQVKTLIAGFDADIAGKLQSILGLPIASQLTGILEKLKLLLIVPAKQGFESFAQTETTSPQERDTLKQELLKLRADIEREQAKLVAIRAEQKKLREELSSPK